MTSHTPARMAAGGITLALVLFSLAGCTEPGAPSAPTAMTDGVPGKVTFLFFYTQH